MVATMGADAHDLNKDGRGVLTVVSLAGVMLVGPRGQHEHQLHVRNGAP